MPSTYTLNNGIELIGTGEQSGTWGDTTNTNLQLLDTALDGQVTVTLPSAGTSGSPNTLAISDGATSDGRNRMVIFDDSSDLGATAYVQLTPNDAEKIIYIRNSLSGSRSIILFQGTYSASNDYELPAGKTAIIYFDGGLAGAVAANVMSNAHFDTLNVVGTSTFGDDVTFTGASYNAVWDKSDNRLEFADNAQLSFGDAADLRIYHDGSHNYIQDAGSGNLYLTTNGTSVVIDDGTNNLAAFNATSGESALYYGGSGKKLATTSTGLAITGNATFEDNGKAIFGAGSDLQIYHDGTNSYITDAGTGVLTVQSNQVRFQNAAGTEDVAFFNQDGDVKLYYDNSLRLSTTSSGVTMQNSNADLAVFMNSVGSATLTIAADSNNVGETDIATLNLTQDNGLTEMIVGLNGDADQVYTGIAANMGYLGSTLGMQIAVDFQNTPFPVAQFGQSGDITFSTATNEQQFKFDYSAGNIGLGLTGSGNPVTLLHLNAPTTYAAESQIFRVSTEAGGALRVHASDFTVSAPTWSIETGSSEPLKFKTGGSIGFQPNSAGSDYANFSTTQILFNTDDLEVVGAAPVVKISNTTEDVAKFVIVDSADGGQNFSFGYDAQLEDGIITIDSNEVMRFHGDGNIYLGSNIPNTQTPYYDAGNGTIIYPQVGLIGNTVGSKNDQTLAIMDYSTSGNNEPQLVLGHGTSGTIGNNSTALVAANNLGRILFNGSDGTKMANGYFIFAEAAADWTSTTSPTNVTYGIEKDNGSYATVMHSHDGYWGIADVSHWSAGTLPAGILHIYGATPKVYIDNTDETEGGIVFRDGNAGDPNAQSAAIKFDSGTAVADNALSFYNNDETALRMRIYNSGEVSHPWQSCINVYRSTNVSPAVNGAIIFNTERTDNNSDYSTSTGKYTAPVTGVYQLNAQVCFDGGNGQDDSMYIYIFKNGSTIVSQATVNPKYMTISGVEMTIALAGTVYADAGDYFQVELADIGATGAPNMLGNATYFSGHLI